MERGETKKERVKREKQVLRANSGRLDSLLCNMFGLFLITQTAPSIIRSMTGHYRRALHARKALSSIDCEIKGSPLHLWALRMGGTVCKPLDCFAVAPPLRCSTR